jgi:hypothetical protein
LGKKVALKDTTRYNTHMLKRLMLATVAAALIPSFAIADDTSSTPPSASSPVQSGAGGAAALGPAASGGSGSSNAAAGDLQPAGTSPLQSTTNDSTGLSAPASALQAPASGSDALQVLSGVADGSPHNVADDQSPGLTWLWFVFPFAGIVAGIYFFLRRLEKNAEL